MFAMMMIFRRGEVSGEGKCAGFVAPRRAPETKLNIRLIRRRRPRQITESKRGLG